jgi:hypothetical protein
MLAPHPLFLIKHPLIMPAIAGFGVITKLIKREPISDIAGQFLGNVVLRHCGKSTTIKAFERSIHLVHNEPAKPWQKINGLGGHSPMILNESDIDNNGRVIKHMTIIYHHANKAGKHIDVHIGRRSLVYRVSGKPVEQLLKFNNKGMLTETSKEALLEHLRKEIKNNSRVAQNLDHSTTNAKMSWPFTPELANESGYGVGPTRQIIAEEDVEFYHPHVRTSLHLYAPTLSPNQGLYLYQLYPGEAKRAPILIFGALEPLPEKHYHDRLHLKLIQPEDFKEQFVNKIDKFTTTRKYDGASCYFNSNGQGFKFFSPRTSVETGKQIEYTYKLAALADRGHKAKPVGMGEVLYWKKILPFPLRGIEGVTWKYMDAASIGGILNSNKIVPRDTHAELRVYRMDRWNGIDVHTTPFWDNRLLQLGMISDLGMPWNVVSLSPATKNPVSMSWEGFVGVPESMSVNDGLKVKWLEDPDDWKLDSINLQNGNKGGIAGVVWFTSLESGKRFKLGTGQLGPMDRSLDMMEHSKKYIGRVAKIVSRKGHEGRAAKFLAWHDSKGIW